MTEKASKICLVSAFDNACSQAQAGTLDTGELHRLLRDVSQHNYADFKNLPTMTKLYDKFYDRQNEALDKFIIYTNDLFDRAGKLEDTDMGIFLQTRINDILETNSVYDTQAANNPDLELEYAKNEAVPSMQRSLSELQQLEIENPALRDYDTGRNRTLAEGAVRRYDEATDAIIKNRDAFRQRSYQQEASMTYTSPATG